MIATQTTKRRFGNKLANQMAKESRNKRLFKEARAKQKDHYEPKSFVLEDEDDDEYWEYDYNYRNNDDDYLHYDYDDYDYEYEPEVLSCHCIYCL